MSMTTPMTRHLTWCLATWFVEGVPHHLQRRVALGADERELKTLPDLIQRAREIYRQEERWPSKSTPIPTTGKPSLPPHLLKEPTPAIKLIETPEPRAQESVTPHPAASPTMPDLNASLMMPLNTLPALSPTNLPPCYPHSPTGLSRRHVRMPRGKSPRRARHTPLDHGTQGQACHPGHPSGMTTGHQAPPTLRQLHQQHLGHPRRSQRRTSSASETAYGSSTWAATHEPGSLG